MVEPLSQQIAVVSAITPTAGLAGLTLLNGSSLDMQAYQADRVLIIVHMGAIVAGAVTSLKVESDDNTNFSSAQDITGSAQTIGAADDDHCFLVDVINPPERFLRIVVSRGTQNATVSALYLVYGLRNKPVSQLAANVAGAEIHRDKAVGTA